MRSRQPNIARPAQTHDSNPVRNGALNTRPLGIGVGEFLDCFPLSPLLQGQVLLLWTNRHGAACMATGVEVTSEPAYVFGSSGGAVVGLDLVARYPEQVRTLIAHEPPSHLLSGLEERHDTIREISRREGATSAMQQFMAQIGVTYDDREPDADLPEQGERPAQNTVFLLKQEFAMYDRYRFDFAALRSALIQTRIVIAAGRSGREYVG